MSDCRALVCNYFGCTKICQVRVNSVSLVELVRLRFSSLCFKQLTLLQITCDLNEEKHAFLTLFMFTIIFIMCEVKMYHCDCLK